MSCTSYSCLYVCVHFKSVCTGAPQTDISYCKWENRKENRSLTLKIEVWLYYINPNFIQHSRNAVI